MKEPRRLIRSGGLSAELLASAREDRAPSGSRKRAFAAAAAAIAATTPSASAAATLGSALTRVAMWKWMAAGVATTLLVVGARRALHDDHPNESVSTVSASAESQSSAGSMNERAPVSSGAIPATAEASSSGAHVPPQVKSSPSAASRVDDGPPKGDAPTMGAEPSASPSARKLALEIAALDGVKRRLAAGDSAGALNGLAAYASKFPDGALSPEADALSIEAFVASGNRGEARTRFEAFRARHPDSPLLEKLDRLVGQ